MANYGVPRPIEYPVLNKLPTRTGALRVQGQTATLLAVGSGVASLATSFVLQAKRFAIQAIQAFTYPPAPSPKIIFPRVSIFSTATFLAVSASSVASLATQVFLGPRLKTLSANVPFDYPFAKEISRISLARPSVTISSTLAAVGNGVASLMNAVSITLFATNVFKSSVLDTFNRANEDPLSGGGNWSSINVNDGANAHLAISSNVAVVSGGSGGAASYWTPLTNLTDCEAYVNIASLTFGDEIHVYARLSDAAGVGTYDTYLARFITASGNFEVRAITDAGNTSNVLIGSSVNVGSLNSGDTIGIRCIGTTIEGWLKRGNDWKLITSGTDSTFSSGAIGFKISGTSSADNFGGGSLTGSAVASLTTLIISGAKAGLKKAYEVFTYPTLPNVPRIIKPRVSLFATTILSASGAGVAFLTAQSQLIFHKILNLSPIQAFDYPGLGKLSQVIAPIHPATLYTATLAAIGSGVASVATQTILIVHDIYHTAKAFTYAELPNLPRIVYPRVNIFSTLTLSAAGAGVAFLTTVTSYIVHDIFHFGKAFDYAPAPPPKIIKPRVSIFSTLTLLAIGNGLADLATQTSLIVHDIFHKSFPFSYSELPNLPRIIKPRVSIFSIATLLAVGSNAATLIRVPATTLSAIGNGVATLTTLTQLIVHDIFHRNNPFTYASLANLPRILKPRVSIFSTLTLLAVSNSAVASIVRLPATTLAALGNGIASLSTLTQLIVHDIFHRNRPFTYAELPNLTRVLKPRVSIFSTFTLLAVSNATVASIIRFPATTLKSAGAGLAFLTTQTTIVYKKYIQYVQAHTPAQPIKISQVLAPLHPFFVGTATLLAVGSGVASLIRAPASTLAAIGSGVADLSTQTTLKIRKYITKAYKAFDYDPAPPPKFFGRVKTITAVQLTAIGAGVAFLMSMPTKILLAVGSGSAALIKMPNKVFGSVGSGNASVSKVPGRILSASGAGVTSLIKSISRTLSVVGVGVAILNRSISRTLTTVVGQGAAFLVKMPEINLGSAGSGSASVAAIKVAVAVFNAVGVSITTLRRDVVKYFSVSAPASARLIKSIQRTFSTVVGNAIASIGITRFFDAFVQGEGSATVSRSFFVRELAIGVANATITRVIGRTVRASGTGFAKVLTLAIRFFRKKGYAGQTGIKSIASDTVMYAVRTESEVGGIPTDGSVSSEGTGRTSIRGIESDIDIS